MSTKHTPGPRSIAYGGPEMKALQRSAKHRHTSDGGVTECFGDGRGVLQVRHPSKRNREPAAVVYEPGCTNLFGNPFVYSDFFLPEELARAAATGSTT